MLNELCVDLPITFIRARIRLVRATIPWRNLLSKSCLLKLDGWELVVVPSEQVQPKASATFSRMLAQSVMNVDVDQNDLELQKSLASLGQHFRARERRHSSGLVTPHTPLSMSGTSSASGSISFGTPQQPSSRHRDAQEDAEEKLHEAKTAAAVRAADKRRKQIEQRRLHREAYGEADEDEEEHESADAANAVHVEDDVNTDDEAAEEAHSVKKHSARQAAALDTANQGLQVVASFLEQVVSAIELEVTDITIRVQHQPKVGHKQTNLSIKLPWIKFSDLNKEAADKQEASKEEERKEAELRAQQAQERRTAAQQRRAQERERRRAERAARRASAGESKEDGFVEEESDADADAHLDDAEAEAAEDEAAIRREMELKMARDAAQASGATPLNSGPKYEYHKSLRFHGFRVELHEEAGMDGSMAQFNSSTGATATAAPASTLLQQADPNRPDEPDAFLPALPEPQTIISGSMDQECIITLKIKMTETHANEPKLESTMFIQSLRALLTPRQLALLTDLAGAIGLSAKQVAISAQLAHQSAILNPPPTVLNAAGGFSPSVPAASLPQRQQPLPPLPPSARSVMPSSLGLAQPLSHPDYTVIEGLLSQQAAASSASAAAAADDQFFDMADGPPGSSGAHHSPAPDQILNLWSMESHILHCSVTLMESDEQSWATDWWSTPVSAEVLERAAGTVSPQPTQIVESIIPGVTCNHLFLSVHHAFLNVNQTSAEATVKLMLGSLQLNEYLVQKRAPTRRPNQRPPLRPQPVDDGVWIGFRARPLISFATPSSSQPSELQYPDSAADLFQRTTRPVAEPHVSVELRTSVDSNHSLSFNEPIARFFEPHENSTVTSRLTLSCQPATIHFDLGLGERLQHIMNAVTVPSAYLNPAAQPPSSTSAHSDNHSFTFDLQRMQSAQGGGLPPMGGEEILHRIADNQRRYSIGGTEQRAADGASYSQTVLIAPTIHLHVLFPATTPSQLQPHPYTRMEMLHQDPYLDARGILRPERIELELHEVSVSNECEVGGAAAPDPAQSVLSTAQLQDAEWMIRFHKAAVFAHFPKLDGAAVARSGAVEESLDDLEMIPKRLLSTTYPSMFPTSAASAAYYSHAVAASFISILTRATPMPGQSRFQPAHDDLRSDLTGSPSLDGSTVPQAEEMFFDSLPHQKFWEVESAPSGSGGAQRAHRAFKQSKSRDDGGSPQQPDAALFESLALANSGMIVTVHLPVAAVHLSKADYDLVMFLYTIYAEFMEPPDESQLEPMVAADELPVLDTFASAAAVPPQSLYRSTLSTQEEDDHVDINGLARSQAFLRHPAAGPHGDDDDDADVGPSGSLSRSDSFSSDSSSEMFESVVGADSVILKHGGGAGKHLTPGGRHAHGSKLHAFPQQHSSMAASANFNRPGGASAHPSASGSFGQAQSSLLKPQASLMLPSLEELRVSHPAPDAPDAPLTMDSSLHPAHRQLEFKGGDDDNEGESGGEEEIAHGPQFQPTLDNSSRSNSPRPLHHSGVGLDHSSPPRESNLSDSDSDSVPGDSEDGSGILRSRRDQDDHKHVNFGSHSILVPQPPKPQPQPQEPTRAALAESAEYQQSEAGSEAAVDDSSSSTELNPTAIFDRASRTSGRAQLFQPAAQMSTLLPPVSELVHPSTLANSSLMQSSMMESRNEPAMFESFLHPPPGVFESRANLIDASVDYSHLPPQVATNRALPPQPPRQPLTQAAPSPQLPLTAHSLAQLGVSPPPAARLAGARPVPPPLTSASVFPSAPPVPPVSTLSPIRPPNPFRHFMSLHLSIAKASIVLQDDPELDPRAPLHPASAAAPAPPLVPSAGPPQSFLIDVGEVRLFQVVEFDNKPVSYIAIRAGDLTVREYNSIVTEETQLFQSTSLPIIFKTMGDELANGTAQQAAAASPFSNIDAWGKPVEMERKYDDDDESSGAHPTMGPLTSLLGGARQAREAASVAWSNPVLIVNVVIKLNAALSLRDTQAVVNLRALTLQYLPESVWIQKLMAFFLPTLYALPVAAPTFNVSASPLPPAVPLIKDLIHVHLHGYDVSLDYNPLGVESRAVIAIDHVHVATTVYPDTTLSVIKVEVRDVNMFMTPRSSKATYAPTNSLSELGRPYLHRIAAASVFAHLESMGYARLATLDFLDVVITQNVPMPGASPAGTRQLAHIPALGVEVSNGLLTILTCWDSFQVFTQICEHFVSSVQQIQRVAEIDIQFDSQPLQSVSAPRSSATGSAYKVSAAAAPNHSQTAAGFHSTAFSVSHHHDRAAYLLDDDEEEVEEKSAAPNRGAMPPVHEERNILDELDHNAFGADLGVAQVYQADPLQLQVNDDYHDLRERQTSLSLALQAAAEREIARARREALGGEEGLQRANSTSPPRLHANTYAASASAPPFVPGSDATAKWLTSRESEEMVERDRHADFISSLTDSEARTREQEMAAEKEERRRRREEERKKEEGGHVRDSKDQRVAPNVIDDHVSLPDDETRSGRARLRPPPGYPNSVSEILLINLSVCWRMFGGQDWDLTRVESPAAPAAAARSAYSNFPHLSPEDSPEVRLGDMGSVDINDFYSQPHEPFVRTPNQHPFGSPPVIKHTAVGQGSMSAPGRGGASSFASDVIPRGARQTDRVMEVLLRGINVRFDQFPAGLQIASRVVVALDDIEVHDLISTSPFNMFLCYYARPGGKGRELGSSMLRWEMTSVRPDPSRAREEYRVKLAVLPLRLNVDQEAVEFFVQFFSHAPIGQENAAAAAAAASVQEGADAPSGAKFHEQYRQALSEAEANILAGLTEYTKRSGIPLHSVQDPHHARVLCSSMIQRRLVDSATIASAISFSPVHFAHWESGHGYDETIGVAVVQLFNRLLQQARSDSDPADDDSDGEDDSLSAGIGGPHGRRGSDPLDFPSPLVPPPMPHDWIPAEFARNHPNLVPFLNEAYQKYYDIIHAAHPELPNNAAGSWRPPPSVLPLAFNESANQYRQRLLEAARTAARTQVKALGANAVREVDNETYIQSFQVTHKIVLCIDWKPNTFDLAGLRGGDFAQLANLLPLENMELDLKAVQMTGITGFARVGVELAQLWAYDLSRHQAHRYLAGVQPIRSMVNVGSGVADLVLLPLEHYKQHGNLKRGVQRGLSSFLKNVSLESMAAAARLAQGAQTILESVDDVLTYRPAPLPSHASSQLKQQRARNRRGRAGSMENGAAAASSSSEDARRKSTHISKRANQPESASDGFRQAYESLARGLQSAASQMIVVPREEYYARGSKGAVKSALKAMPSALLSPVIGGMEAIAKALNGITNSIEPARRKENQDKFKSASSS